MLTNLHTKGTHTRIGNSLFRETKVTTASVGKPVKAVGSRYSFYYSMTDTPDLGFVMAMYILGCVMTYKDKTSKRRLCAHAAQTFVLAS